jgi:Spy/CpxP family protein refolding chaperone
MKILLLSSLLAVAGAPTVLAQAPARAVVKTKAKPAGQAGVKTKTRIPAVPAAPEAPAPLADPAVVDAKSNALTTNMQQNLGLTPQQTEKVRAINRRSIDAVESAHLRYKADPRKLAGVVESVSSSRLSAIKDVLTPQQFAKYQRKREEKMGVPNVQGVQGTPPPGLGSGPGDQ